MAVSVDQFGKSLVASGLATAEEIKSLWAALPAEQRPKEGDALAQLLVERGKLTKFQAEEILAGRGGRLVMGDYTLLAEIGAGGMGHVYKAQHKRMNRTVALKVMTSAAMKDEASVKRFQREVRAAARLEHPNIVTAYDSGEAGNVKYLVMQFVDGGDLSDLVKKHGPLPVEQAVDYVLQTARGLAFAHGEGVIHRDIKPANLLLDKKGIVRILDMGLARIEDSGDGLTATEQVMGTVDYMSPEQATETKNADARSDIYSLGCTLWYLLTARKLYEADTMISRLMKHRDAPLPSLVKERDDAPWPLEQALHKMIAKRPQDRFQSMDEVVAALEPYGGGTAKSGSSSGIGSQQNAELAAFLHSAGPGAKPQAKSASSNTNVAADATELLEKSDTKTKSRTVADTRAERGDGKSGSSTSSSILSRGAQPNLQPRKKKSSTVLVAGGLVGAAVVIGALVANLPKSEVTTPDADASGSLPQQTPVAYAPASPDANQLSPLKVLDSIDYVWSEPENLGPAINSPQSDRWPALSLDELSLVFASSRDSVHFDFFECRRASADQPFGPAVGVKQPPWISGKGGPALSPDGLELLFHATAGPNNLGHVDIFQVRRPTRDAPWQWPAVNMGPVINTAENDFHPAYSPDGLSLYFSSAGRVGSGGNDLYVSRRASLTAPWRGVENLGGMINTATLEDSPSVLSDNRTVVFCHDGALTATFTSMSGITSGVTLPTGTETFDSPWVSPDGRRIYFASKRIGGQGDFDLWTSRRVSKNEAAAKPAATSPATSADGSPAPARFPFDAAQAARHQTAWAAYLGVSVEFTNTLGMKFRLIPPGEFLMGLDLEQVETYQNLLDPKAATIRGAMQAATPQHRVRITRPFYMEVEEVRAGWFNSAVGRPPHASSDEKPDDPLWRHVCWPDAIEFCNKLSEREGKRPAYAVVGTSVSLIAGADGYRLPTEAQWEYACRGGTDTLWFFGNDPHEAAAGSPRNFARLHGAQSHYRRDDTQANPFGLLDMYAGANEWCWDAYTNRYSPERIAQVDDPMEQQGAGARTKRGGSHFGGAGSDAGSSNSFARESGRGEAIAPDAAGWKYLGFGRVVLPIVSKGGVAPAAPAAK